MSPVVDLHSHTFFSDGSLSPTELVHRAHEKGVNILALTDHDETAGLAEAQKAASQRDITLINGVEVSVTWNRKTIHVVGLNIDPENKPLQAGLKLLREERIRRAKKIADKLEKAGIPNVFQELTDKVGFEAVTRTHFAQYLLEKGHVKDMNQAFKRFLGRKGKAYVNGAWIGLPDALALINRAGGQAVIAHPIRYKYSRTKLEELVTEFKQHGGAGIEVVASRNTLQERAQMASVARRFDLMASVGSDFHFPGNPYVELGYNLELPVETKAIWESWQEYKRLIA